MGALNTLDSLTLIYCNKDQLVVFVFEEFFVKCIVSPHLWLSRVKPQAKSLYMSRAVSIFNRTEFEIWAGLGRLAVSKTPNLAYYILGTFEGSFFFVWGWGELFCFLFFLNTVASALKS